MIVPQNTNPRVGVVHSREGGCLGKTVELPQAGRTVWLKLEEAARIVNTNGASPTKRESHARDRLGCEETTRCPRLTFTIDLVICPGFDQVLGAHLVCSPGLVTVIRE